MASVTVQKWTTAGACGGQVRHIYREAEHYKNTDIKKDGQAWMLGTGEDCRAAIRQTIAEIDKWQPPKRIKKDRKTVAELCIPAPREHMSEKDCLRFFEAVYGELYEKGYHVCGGAIHGDEVHDYIDPSDKQVHTSRLHLHILVVPETAGKGLNMKSWLTKARFRELNALCDRVCTRELGFTFVDGSKSRSRGTVEKMKEESAIEAARQLPALQQAAKAAQASREAAERAAEAAEIDKKRVEAAKAALERQAQESRETAARAAQEARESIAKADKERQKATKIEKESADRIHAATQEIQRAFPAGCDKSDYLEEKEVKTGLLQKETVTVARRPAAVAAAVEKAQAAAAGLRELDAVKQENKVLREKLRDAEQELVELRADQEHLRVLEAVEQAQEDPYIREQLDDRRIGMTVDDLTLTPAQAVQALRMLKRLDETNAKAQGYDRIMRTAQQRPDLHIMLEKNGLIKKKEYQRDRGLIR